MDLAYVLTILIPVGHPAHKANTSVEPDMIGFDGHEFSINESTPTDIRDALLAYFDSDATYADIPEEYRIYEVVENAEED
ncbi:hypothetical protein BDQ94DRAFT_173001 [Aspergillus welwitschiae]|uniref:Uncharacterized protein n=1 Tax=Aspergillus welwitschiae TaxID=1341132 RepID=A0A3F3PTV8_9EURO|nr:hypothetical protein BDQ94DRAFT_173001 [Aspergillus welwitschiae]RDH30305.1 hypothetical protein BDQ94DRAFT_173001 [Aspergillus welwitschiae]